MSRTYTSEDLAEAGSSAIQKIVAALLEEFATSPGPCLKTVRDSAKRKLVADESAERDFRSHLRRHHNGQFKEIIVHGEESLGSKKPIDLTGKSGMFALVDALDGSDLYERGLYNWCSAATFFTPTNPEGKRIRAVVVGLPDRSIYYATDTEAGVLVKRSPKAPAVKVRGMSRVTSLINASICFYGQKLTGLCGTAKNSVWDNVALDLPE